MVFKDDLLKKICKSPLKGEKIIVAKPMTAKVFIMFVGGTACTIKFFLSVSSAGSAIKPPAEVTAVI